MKISYCYQLNNNLLYSDLNNINHNIKPSFLYDICNNNFNKINLFKNLINKIDDYSIIEKILNQKQIASYNENIIYTVNKLLFLNKKMKNEIYIHDNDKTIISLLFHENIIDYLTQSPDYTFYKKFLKNICEGDFLDRICFQKQIWIFNEMTYFIKIDQNYEEYNKLKETKNIINKKNNNINNTSIVDIKKNLNKDSRFTKILTKYSTEYNNNNFIISLCKKLQVDRKSLFNIFASNIDNETFYNELENYDINKLDINRINNLINNN